MRRAALFSCLLAVVLAGCFASSKPPSNVGFRTTHTLQEFSGTYQNRGVGDPREDPDYLSQIIWPNDPALHHEDIRTISVRAISDKELAVRALGDQGVVKEGSFVSGKDFKFSDGRLRLRTRSKGRRNKNGVGGLFMDRTTRELGLDERGQGKLQQRETIVGAAFLVVPIAASWNLEVRFVRLGEP